METTHHGNASKNRLIKHSIPVKGGLKVIKCTGDYHFIFMGLYAYN